MNLPNSFRRVARSEVAVTMREAWQDYVDICKRRPRIIVGTVAAIEALGFASGGWSGLALATEVVTAVGGFGGYMELVSQRLGRSVQQQTPAPN